MIEENIRVDDAAMNQIMFFQKLDPTQRLHSSAVVALVRRLEELI